MCISVRAAVDRFAPAGEDLLVAHQVALGAAQVGAERAEHAAVDADVRRVQMRVDVVVGAVAVLPLADQVGQLAHFGQRHVGPIEELPVVERQAARRPRPCRESSSSVGSVDVRIIGGSIEEMVTAE